MRPHLLFRRALLLATVFALPQAHAIAPGAFLGGTGKAPRVAAASDDNYGETAKVIWLAYLALGLADVVTHEAGGTEVQELADPQAALADSMGWLREEVAA